MTIDEKENKKLATGNGRLTTQVLNETEMKKLGMGSLLSVSRGSRQPAKLIIMQYKGAGSEAPVVLVGKGENSSLAIGRMVAGPQAEFCFLLPRTARKIQSPQAAVRQRRQPGA